MITVKYNQSKTVKFSLVAPDGVDLIIAATFAAGDIKISKDEGAEVNTTNLPTDEGTGYSLVLTAAEMSAARISLYIIDQTATKVWLDIPIEIETYGNASAEHAFDLDTAAEAMRGTDNALLAASINLTGGAVDTVTNLTNLPAIPANWLTAAGIAASALNGKGDWNIGKTGYTLIQVFPANFDDLWIQNISGRIDVGFISSTPQSSGTNLGLTIPAILADTLELQTDWTNGGRLDLIIDAIKAVTDLLPDAGALTTLITHLTDIKGGTFSGATDSLEAIRDRGDAAWVTGAGGTPPQLLQSTTIATLASQTSFTLTAGSADDNAYNGAIAVITDQATSTQKAVGTVSDYVGATKTITLAVDPTIFTMAVGDTIEIIAALGSAGDAPTAIEIRTEMDTNSTQLAAIVADTNELQTDDVPGLIAALNNLSAAQVNAEADTALVDFFVSSAQLVDNMMDEVLTGATHNVTDSLGKRIRDLQEWGSYEGGAIFIDTVNGAAGTTNYESGTILNPVNTITDANTLAASLNLSRFVIAPASSIVFAVSQNGQIFNGIGWILALGGQDISNSEIIGAQSVTGIATTPTGEVHFIDCELVSGTLGQAHLKFCGLGGTLTLSAAANYTLSNCYSQIPGSPTPIIDFGAAVGNTGLSMRSYSGGIEIQNYGVTGIDTMSLEGNGQLVINANCAGGTIYVRGNFKVTDNSGGAVTIVYDDNTANAIAILEDTSATIPAQIGALNDPTAAAVAAAVASFDMGNGRTIEEALAFLRNKWEIISGVLTVYDTDDTTVLWTSAMTQTAGNPVSASDPT